MNSYVWSLLLGISFAAAVQAQTVPSVVSVVAPGTSSDIQRALDGLPDEGGEVVLRAGVYTIQTPVVLRRDRQTLRGCGAATILRLADGANCPVVVLGSSRNDAKPWTAHLRLADLYIDGNRRKQDVELWKITGQGSAIRNNGVTVRGCEDASVERVEAHNCRSGGLVAERHVRRLTVRDFTASDNEFDGLAAYETEESLFTGLYLHDNVNGAGISIDLMYRQNLISDAILARNDLGIFMRETHDSMFQNVLIRDSKKHGIFMARTYEDTLFGLKGKELSECSRNTFIGLQVYGCGGSAIRVNDAACTNNLVNGGRFHNNKQGGISAPAYGIITVQGVAEN